jgi:hypothetical protein
MRRTWGKDTLGDGCRGSFCSGVTVSVGTLGDCVCGVGCPVVVVTVGTLGVSPGRDAILSNTVANSLITCIRFDPSCWKGFAGDGRSSAWVRLVAAIMAASALDRPGTLQCWDINSNMSTICSCPVDDQYIRWHR